MEKETTAGPGQLSQILPRWKNKLSRLNTLWIWRGISVKIIDFSHHWIILAIAKFDFSDG